MNQSYGTIFRVIDIENQVEADLLYLDQYTPPRGRFLLCYADEELAGMASLRDIGMEIGEIKRCLCDRRAARMDVASCYSTN